MFFELTLISLLFGTFTFLNGYHCDSGKTYGKINGGHNIFFSCNLMFYIPTCAFLFSPLATILTFLCTLMITFSAIHMHHISHLLSVGLRTFCCGRQSKLFYVYGFIRNALLNMLFRINN